MIRSATLLDTPKILDLVKEFYPLTHYSKIAEFDDETVSGLIDTLKRRGILLVAQQDENLIGIIGFVGVPFIFNSTVTTGHEVIWWVRPEYRNTSVGVSLLTRADQIASLKGWSSLQMMRLDSSDPRIDSVLIAAGFLPTEHCFTKVY